MTNGDGDNDGDPIAAARGIINAIGLTLAAVALIALASLISSCAAAPAVAIDRTPVPAQVQADDLAAQEAAARLAAASASAAADTAATTEDRHQAVREAARQQALAATLASLRAAAESRAVAQRDELDRRAAAAAKQAREQAAAEQAVRDRRVAVVGLALALAASVVAAVVLFRLGLPRLGLALPAVVASAGGVGLGVLSAGPWLAPVLGTVVGLGLLAAVVLLGRAVVHAVAYGDSAGRMLPGEIEGLRKDVREIHRKAGVRGMILAGIKRVRKS
jgi:hypothetical protein